jgi:hypothetical protein
MGAADVNQPISIAALHQADGEPLDCVAVNQNFIRGTSPSNYGPTAASVGPRTQGVVNSALTMQGPGLESSYGDTGNVLKVSYFIKSDATGTEFGNDAVHIANFMDGASITNQKQGINEGDLQGFDHPDLNGGAPTSVLLGIPGVGQRGAYEPVRVALGARSVINDWSKNTTTNGSETFTVDTDWVVTTPGQYLMTNLSAYIDSLETNGTPCTAGVLPATEASYNPVTGANCDFRDIPLTVTATVWDREEREIDVADEDLVVSPQPPGEPTIVSFDQEVNVVSWGSKTVLDSAKNVIIPVPAGAEAGWATVSVTPNTQTEQGICDFTDYGLPLELECLETTTPVPLVGFVAWQRNFGSNPDANYGRIIEHSFVSGSFAP